MHPPTTHTPAEENIWALLDEVPDPEVPVLSVVDLGMVRGVRVREDGKGVEIILTPTYSGCPAVDAIRFDIRLRLMGAGWTPVDIIEQLSPAWTTDWMSAKGRSKLASYGIAPPQVRGPGAALFEETSVTCPQCGSPETRLLSQFGATACKALYQCTRCRETFDYFKCH